ncbi:MAG: DNA mismatch repair protein MutS [Candidatus Melainabacteria bacterium]|nr:DNA mismatch repair protein MutS [Candidatus Melainabacteria bacterium]
MESTPEQEKQLSPMMRQFWDVKKQYPDCLLFFRVGDFYETFDEDARIASQELDITLTGRPEPFSPNGRMPMAGVPYRAYEVYLGRLLAKGYSVALCEQVGIVGAEKGPVERKVTRVFTPGTVLESQFLNARENNYLASIFALNPSSNEWGLAYVDASCGEFFVCQTSLDHLLLELGRINPQEVLVPFKVVKSGPNNLITSEVPDLPEVLKDKYRFINRAKSSFNHDGAIKRIQETFNVASLEGFGCQNLPLAVSAAGAILHYLDHTQGALRPVFEGITTYGTESCMVMDENTRRNLELCETHRTRVFEGSLLWVLDQTRTAMGGRMLRKWLMKPLFSVPEIKGRQSVVAAFCEKGELRKELYTRLGRLSDLERLSVKLSSQSANPRDLVAIKDSIGELPELVHLLNSSNSLALQNLLDSPDQLLELRQKIETLIQDEPAREITEGNIFKSGASKELDEVRELLGGGKDWIEDLQQKEIERTGIKKLKISFNRTFGYYIEVSAANKDSVPDNYIRKQTLANAERFITPELKEHESKVLNAEKNQNDLEYKMYCDLKRELAPKAKLLHQVALSVARLDAFLSLAQVATDRNFVCPEVDESQIIDIKNGRHPVLESILPMGKYVANDVLLKGSSQDHQLIVLTGPNMSGKSSYLRQVALICIMAQIGSFVPAQSARLGIVDRIFTRIGAVDDLTQGQSTFLVEMSETTQCCRLASDRSLILLDEVGRGTSTYDGVAIAWSVAEYLAQEVKARTIFATHYHELNGLSNTFPQIENYQVLVKEKDGDVEFIRAVVPGGASRSFGVQVAKMAGLPLQIVQRAQYLINQLEKRAIVSKLLDAPKFKEKDSTADNTMQLSLFEAASQKNDLLAVTASSGGTQKINEAE